jgi:hypothetical protein
MQQRGKKTLLSLTLICYCHLVGMAKIVRGSTFVRPWNTATCRFGWLTVLWHCLNCFVLGNQMFVSACLGTFLLYFGALEFSRSSWHFLMVTSVPLDVTVLVLWLCIGMLFSSLLVAHFGAVRGGHLYLLLGTKSFFGRFFVFILYYAYLSLRVIVLCLCWVARRFSYFL